MRTLGIVVVFAFLCSSFSPVAAQQTDSCKPCRDQYQRCVKNYPGKTCKTEVDICLKTCRKK